MMRVIHNAMIVNRGAMRHGFVVISGDTITEVNYGTFAPASYPDAIVEDAEGALLLPGVIDTHVHFRDPGLTAKGDFASESLAAVSGGVTSVIDMPNTLPPTTTRAHVEAKLQRAAEVSHCNYACYIGVATDNLEELRLSDYSRVGGIKLFLGSTTGDMMVSDGSLISEILSLSCREGVPVVVHAEDEATIQANLRALNPEGLDDLPVEMHPRLRDAQACLRSSSKIVDLARSHGAKLHLAHVSTAAELALLEKGCNKLITAETCPQYLLFSADDYITRGSRIKCNPAVKTAADRDALRTAVESGVIDTIATDHAPHLLADKQGGALKAKSGMPMVQFSLVKMLDLFEPQLVAQIMAHAPAGIFGICRRGFVEPGYKADIVLVERLDRPHTITDSDVVSRCGWTPLNGIATRHRVKRSYVNGTPADEARNAQPLLFDRVKKA